MKLNLERPTEFILILLFGVFLLAFYLLERPYMGVTFYNEVLTNLRNETLEWKTFFAYQGIHPLYMYLQYLGEKIHRVPVLVHQIWGVLFFMFACWSYLKFISLFSLERWTRVFLLLFYILAGQGFSRLYVSIEDNIFFHGLLLLFAFYLVRNPNSSRWWLDAVLSGIFLALGMLMNILLLVFNVHILAIPLFLYKKRYDLVKKSTITFLSTVLSYQLIWILLFQENPGKFMGTQPILHFLKFALKLPLSTAPLPEGIFPALV